VNKNWAINYWISKINIENGFSLFTDLGTYLSIASNPPWENLIPYTIDLVFASPSFSSTSIISTNESFTWIPISIYLFLISKLHSILQPICIRYTCIILQCIFIIWRTKNLLNTRNTCAFMSKYREIKTISTSHKTYVPSIILFLVG
jgi:hypothetical protein